MRLKEQIDQELKELHPDEQLLQDLLKQSPRQPFRFRLLLCGTLLGLLAAFPVSAHVFGTIFETTPITDENRALLMEPNIAQAEEAPAGAPIPAGTKLLPADPETLSETTFGIVQEAADGAFLPDVISVVPLSAPDEDTCWDIPQLLTANGFATIFSRESYDGWYLQKGETLSLRLQIGQTAGTSQEDPAETMEIGFIQDHVFYPGDFQRTTDFSYTLTAPETGTYYLYCINCSSNKIYIEKGEIRQ